MKIHPHEIKILQIHNARPKFVKNITPSITLREIQVCDLCQEMEQLDDARFVKHELIEIQGQM
jgi:hypothetical protein